jgi:type VI secretion system protein ImpA
MADNPLIDEDALLAPIPGDEPAGGPVPFTVREQLEAGRREDDPASYAPDDPTRPTEFRKADWAGVIRLARTALTTQSKDLLTSSRLTEALTRLHGFAGLASGLRVQRRLVEEAWDRLRPEIDDPNDLEVRAGPFNWLGDPDRGARFPGTVRDVPLLSSEGGPVSWNDWKKSQDPRNAALRESIEKAIAAAAPDACKAVADCLDAAAAELTGLTDALAKRMGPQAPSLTGLIQAVADCRTLASQIVARKGPAGPAADASPAAATAPVAAPAAPGVVLPSSLPATRDEIYRRLGELARLLRQMEPHSPIPYLILRAVELGSMPFPQLLRAMVRDNGVIEELNRELGIKPEPEG